MEKYLYGLNPLTTDTDGDGISDYDEIFVYHSNPLSTNTSGDGIPDGWKVQHGMDPLVSSTKSEAGFDGVTYMQVYQYDLTHTNQLDPNRPFAVGTGLSNYEIINNGHHTNRFYYDHEDRLIGMESSRGISIAYEYDGNGNLTRQTVLSRTSESNGLPVLWSFLNGLTNGTATDGPYGDADGDGWNNYQEWLAGSNPNDPNSCPNLLGDPGTNIASLALPFTPSNFVVGVGQLDGLGAEEIVVGPDGNPGTNVNFLLVLTQTATGWSTQRVDVGSFGVTSIAVGQVANRPKPAIYAGLRQAGGTGRIMELMSVGGVWQTNIVATSTNASAFVLGVRSGGDFLANYAPANGVDGGLYSLNFTTNVWSSLLLNSNTSHRGLGMISLIGETNTAWRSLRLLDGGGLEISGLYNGGTPTNQGLLGWYPFNGSAADMSGNGHDGINVGAILTTDRLGNPGRAYAFNGSNSWIDVAGIGFAGQSFSLSAWAKRKVVTPANSALLFGYGDANGLDYEKRLHIGFRATSEFTCAFYADDLNTTPISDYDAWHFWVVTFDAATRVRKIYRDGVLATNDVAAAVFQGSGAYLHIGRGPFDSSYFNGSIDDVGIFSRALTGQEVAEISSNQSNNYLTLQEPAATNRVLWCGTSLCPSQARLAQTNAPSIFYAFNEDKNGDGVINAGDTCAVAEYQVNGTNVNLLSVFRQPLTSISVASSYGLASVNFLNNGNEVLFTAEPDGQVFAWTATGGTNPLNRQLFSAQYVGKAWHALAGVKTLEPGESFVGLMVDPTNQNTCNVIFWSPQSSLRSVASLPETAPAAAVIPSSNPLGSIAIATVRLWDNEGNSSTPFLQYQLAGSTNWQNATLWTLDGILYSPTVRVSALPSGVNHTVAWNAMNDLGANVATNVLLRVRAQDFMLMGDWSVPTPFTVNMNQDANGNGIPDWWEWQHFGSLQPGNGDFDGDGVSNYAEYIADTDPADPTSYLHISGVRAVPGGVRIAWQGGTWATQYLQQRAGLGLTNGPWVDLFTNLPPTPNPSSFTNSVGTNRTMFYRIRVTR